MVSHPLYAETHKELEKQLLMAQAQWSCECSCYVMLDTFLNVQMQAGSASQFQLKRSNPAPVINYITYCDQSKQYVKTDLTLMVAWKELHSAVRISFSACRHDSTTCIAAE